MKRCLQPQLPYSVQLRSGACFRSALGASGYLPLPCFARRQRVGATTMRSVASNSSVSRFCARAEQVSQGSRMRGLCPLAVGRKATHLCSSAGHPAGMLLAAESTLVHDRQEDAVSPQVLPRLPYGYPSLHNPCFAVSSWSDSGSPYCSEVFSVFLAPSWQQKASSVSGVIRPQFDPAPEVNPSITPGPSVPDPKLPPADPSPWPSTPPEFRPDVAPSEFPEPETVPSITPTPDPVAPPEMPAPEVSPLEIPYPPLETPVPEIVPVPFPSPEIPSPSPSSWPSSPPLEVPSPHPSIPEISYGMWGRLASLYPCVAGLLLLLPWAITVQPAHPSILPPLPEVGFIQEGISLTGVPRGPPISPPNTPPLTPPGVPLPTPPPSTPPIPPPGAPPPTAPPQTPPIPPGEPGPLPPPTTPPFPPGGLPSPGPPEFPPTPSPGPEIFPPGPNVI